jgi:hypothetical protein
LNLRKGDLSFISSCESSQLVELVELVESEVHQDQQNQKENHIYLYTGQYQPPG